MKNPCVPLVILALVLSGCGSKEPSPAAEAEHSSPDKHASESHADVVLSDEAAKIAGIEVEPARQESLQSELKVPGVITQTAQGKALVTPPVEGKVIRLLATVGDSVRQGQPLAVIESADLAEAMSGITDAERSFKAAESEVKQAQSELSLSQGRLRTAKTFLQRQQELAKAGAFSQPSVQQAEKDLNEAESELESAQREEAVHRTQLERAERLFKIELISKTELEQARLELENDTIRQEKAKRQIAIAKSTFEREKLIAQRGILTAKEIQSAEADVRSANLEIEKGKIALQGARDALAGAARGTAGARARYAAIAGRGNTASGSTLTLVAPISGVIAERKVNTGQALERTTELFQIDNLQAVWVTANVPERQVSQVRLGAQVSLATTGYKGRTFTGVVQVVGTRLDPHSRTMPVQCLVQNPGGLLRPDMFAQVNLGTGTRSTTITVAKSSIFTEGDKSYVYVAEGSGIYSKHQIQLGREQGSRVEIVSGIEPGAKVVAKGVFVLSSQAKKDELKGHED